MGLEIDLSYQEHSEALSLRLVISFSVIVTTLLLFASPHSSRARARYDRDDELTFLSVPSPNTTREFTLPDEGSLQGSEATFHSMMNYWSAGKTGMSSDSSAGMSSLTRCSASLKRTYLDLFMAKMKR
jgi:hypothetical protein